MKWALLGLLFVFLVALPIYVWAGWPARHAEWFGKSVAMNNKDDQDRVAAQGQFGDSFGALNALFSGCAFAAIAITLVLQMIELEQQRKETNAARTAQQQSEYRNNTFRMFEQWSSDYMRRHREVAHPAVYQRCSVVIGSEPRDVRSSLDVVCHFFRDLGILFDSRLVDRELASRLFGDDVEHWLPMLNQVNFEDDQRWYDQGARRTLDYFRQHCAARHAEPSGVLSSGDS